MGLKKIGYPITVIVIAVFLYITATSIYTAQTTGLLNVSSSNKTALLTISQNNHDARAIGIGSAKVRVPPGIYQVAATNGLYQDFAIAQINKKQEVSLELNPVSSPRPRTAQSIIFSGTDALINNGLTINQISALKLAFFKFKSSAQTVNISTANIVPVPHNPDSNSIFDTINFSVKVDGQTYNAKVEYWSLTFVRLYLYTTTSTSVVFDSDNVSD